MKIIESILQVSGGKANVHTVAALWDRPELVAALKHALDTGIIKHWTGPSGGLYFALPDYGDDSSEPPSREEKEEHGKVQEILDILATSADLMSVSTISKKAGLSRDKAKRLIDGLCEAGKVVRSGERYGLK